MMKINRPINECRCDNCKKYDECLTKGIFDEDTGLDFCKMWIIQMIPITRYKAKKL